ncbi:ABC transporter ATP-binding protein [Frateuria sp. Soil773]|uniref:ABC transporter permease n=1 Tax=Frateuria sp. Soil773 TaxID=1736407 RepID=UPI0007001E77|nr:ABC transporter permease [Frateuria sp. Soil773]KRE88598.1 ABC transporter ATP-binding protein [Frateuria sp. Soil773]
MFVYYLDLALRSLKRNKVLTALMVIAIAVGIGASMTTLTVTYLLSGDPLPGRSQRIFYPQVNPSPHASTKHGPWDVMDYRSAMDLWSARRADRQALIANATVKLGAPGSGRPPLMVPTLATTADFFPMFDAPFRYGRGWSADDDAGRTRVVVISDDLNRKLFGGEDSVGRTLRLKDGDVRIVGVLAPWRPSPVFYDVRGGRYSNGDTASFFGRPEDVFVPFAAAEDLVGNDFDAFTCWAGWDSANASLQSSPCVWMGLWVQLDDAAKVAGYRSFLASYAAQQKTLGRIAYAEDTRMMGLMQWLDFNQVVPSDVRLQTWLAFAFLAICLFNTVGLLLAKFLRRGGEIGVRRALGATRRAVFAQCLVEAGLIGVLGGVGGWLLTLLGLWLIRRQPVAYADLARLDVAMFLVTFGLAVAVSLLAGALPAMRASRIAPALQLKVL